MAFTNFYLVAGGTGSADINAGSTIGAAQASTSNGNWNAATGVFIAASGTPFASTVIGDYAAVCTDAATVTTFVGQVTAVTSNTQITVDVTTIKYGTAPSTSATGRKCTINGSWNTEQVLAAGGLATTTVPQSTKININGNRTVASNRIISMAGTTTAALWFSGYNTTPGDLDNDTTNALAKPVWTLGSNTLTTSGAFQMWSGLSVTGSPTQQLWSFSGTLGRISRCRVENTSANANAYAFANTGNGMALTYSWFKAPATATAQGVAFSNATFSTRGCAFEGGGKAGLEVTGGTPVVSQCAFLNNVVGLLSASSSVRVDSCTVSNASSDGVKWTGTPAIGSSVTGTLFRTIGGYGINNASGTNTGQVSRSCNDFYNCASGTENGFGDSPAFFGQTESADPVISASNMTPKASSNAINNGFPGIFENEAWSSYAAIGSTQPLAASGGGYSGGVYGG